jgi:hypothetical protein
MSLADGRFTLIALSGGHFTELNPIAVLIFDNFGSTALYWAKAIWTFAACAFIFYILNLYNKTKKMFAGICVLFISYFFLMIYWYYLILQCGYDFSCAS